MNEAQFEQKKKNTLRNTRFNSLFMQPKVEFSGSFTATSTPTTITHNLGTIPYIRIWAEQLSGEITVPILVSAYTVYHSRYSAVPNVLYYLTSTSLVIWSTPGSAKVYYRIYKI